VRRLNLISSIVLLAIAAAVFLDVSRVPIGTPSRPESGFYPLIMGCLLTVLSLILLGQTFRERRAEGRALDWRGLRKVAVTVLALFAFAFFLERLGYLLSIFLLIGFLMKAIEPQKWWRVLLVAFLCSFVSFLIFGLALNTPLPPGLLGI
jgi:putative tricarboxylic transport membrane protein